MLYSDLISQGFENIISIHAASALSGIYNAAHSAAQALGNKVSVVDSQQISLGLGFQVLAAAEGIASGMSMEAILNMLEDLRKRIRLIAMLDTLEYVRRSGRVSWAKARIGGLLRIKPFLEVKDGKVLSLGEARTRKKGVERLTEIISKLGHLEKIALLHSNAEADARKLQQRVKSMSDDASLLINVTTVIGVHVGPNGLGFAAIIS
jgi:DegV family protein with EDD domain